jgi:hypothetical protein
MGSSVGADSRRPSRPQGAIPPAATRTPWRSPRRTQYVGPRDPGRSRDLSMLRPHPTSSLRLERPLARSGTAGLREVRPRGPRGLSSLPLPEPPGRPPDEPRAPLTITRARDCRSSASADRSAVRRRRRRPDLFYSCRALMASSIWVDSRRPSRPPVSMAIALTTSARTTGAIRRSTSWSWARV